MLGVTEQKDTLDSVESVAGEVRQSVGGGGGTLRVTLKDETMIGVGPECGSDSIDNVPSGTSRDLGETGRVDGSVDFTTRFLRKGVSVHRPESGGFTLSFTRTSGVDDGVSWTSGSLPLDQVLDRFEDGSGEGEVGQEREDGKDSKHLDGGVFGLGLGLSLSRS